MSQNSYLQVQTSEYVVPQLEYFNWNIVDIMFQIFFATWQ